MYVLNMHAPVMSLNIICNMALIIYQHAHGHGHVKTCPRDKLGQRLKVIQTVAHMRNERTNYYIDEGKGVYMSK